jgi:hypothetical protein
LKEPILINGNKRSDTLFAYQEFKKQESKATSSNSSAPKSKITKEDKKLTYTSNLEGGGQQDLLSNLEINFTSF